MDDRMNIVSLFPASQVTHVRASYPRLAFRHGA
jgi:hypothetical protein